MDLSRERFDIGADKEYLLQILHLNNVPTIELVDPKTCAYPIIGRKYGRHSGKDVSVIHTFEQAINEGCDFHAKLYSIENEYLVEVEGLRVKKVQTAVVRQAVFHEVPVRTEAFGWGWTETEISAIPADWLSVAIRALYVTGHSHGSVKIGRLPKDAVLVTDIQPTDDANVGCDMGTPPPLPFTIGADVEFMLSCDGELLPASTFFSLEGAVGCDERQLEQDSGEYALVEIRPKEAPSPQELYANVKELLAEASLRIPYGNIEFRAGSMPFYGYQCGGHLHFGIPASRALLTALDHYLAIPVAMVEETRSARLRRRTNHGGLGRFREKPYGFEYLSLSSWLHDPKFAASILSLAYLVASHHHQLPSHFVFDSGVQRAYYNGNRHYLRTLWPDIKATLAQTSSYPLFEHELAYLFERIEQGNPFAEECDLRRNWDMAIPELTYDPGFVIQIPKRLRLKYGLKDGETYSVCAGKNMASAVVRAYPFTFRNPNAIHLSEALRKRLNLPKDWNPKLTASGGVISLGPIVGILANRPFDRQRTYLQHLCRLGHDKQMFVYMFEPQDILWDQQMIRGTSLTGEGLFPFPAVIYDRFLFANDTKAFYIDEVRAKLQSIHHIPFINSPALFNITGDKWESHRLLLQKHEKYLPETHLLEGPGVLASMLDRYGEIYVKPIFGAMSHGVIRVIRRPGGVFAIDLNKKVTKQFQTAELFYNDLAPSLQTNPHIVQEGIRRKQYKGSNLEVRVYMQKNERQIWLRTGMIARLASESVLTGDTETDARLSSVMSALYPDFSERRSMMNQMAKLSRSIVAAVEEKVGAFGELAVDLCIDQYDSIKLLEINAKPDSLFSQIRAYKLRTLAGIRLLNYAASISGYDVEGARTEKG